MNRIDFLQSAKSKARAWCRLPLAIALSVGLSATAEAQTEAERIAELEARISALEAALSTMQGAATAPPLGSGARPPAPAPAPGAPVAAKPPVLSMPNAVAGTQFFFSGFVKLDAMLSNTNGGELADGGIARDLYVPGLIPVGGADEGTDLDLHAKFSRLIFGTDSIMDDGRTVQTRLEGDFFGNGLGDERFNNAAGFVLRHAYLNFDNRWLIGQTWSTFMDASTLPESTDLIGPTDGTVFVRQQQVRYTNGPWMFALENPETTITPAGGGARISSDDNIFPDLVMRYNHKTAGGGTLGLAGIVRELTLETTGTGAVDDSTSGYGLSFFGKIPFGADDLRFAITGGQGLGRYIGLNEDNDAGLDASRKLDAIGGIYGFVAYRHVFNPQLRGSVFYARAEFDNPSAGGLLQTKSSQSLHANLFYSPVPKWDLGAELIYAERELESGADGDLVRLHASVKYSF